MMATLEPLLSQAIDAVLLDLPGDPTAAVLQQLHKTMDPRMLQQMGGMGNIMNMVQQMQNGEMGDMGGMMEQM